jgi:hypothetical protein
MDLVEGPGKRWVERALYAMWTWMWAIVGDFSLLAYVATTILEVALDVIPRLHAAQSVRGSIE